MQNIKVFDDCVHELSRLPGVGRKTAVRLALHILKLKQEQAYKLSDAIKKLKDNIKFCKECGSISETEVCPVCSDESRKKDIICIVEEAKDVFFIENTGRYFGLYHVLGGKISPLDGIGPSDLSFDKLTKRVQDLKVKEVIIMMPFTITSLLFSQCLSPLVISYRGHHDNIAVAKYKSLRAMNIAYIVLFLAVVFYAISFNLTMSQEEAIIAFHNNISALAMVAQSSGTTVQIFSFVLNIFAVVTAFFGAFLGFKEALYGLTMNVLRRIWNEDQLNPKYIRMGIYAFAILIPWLVVVINIPILSMFIFISPVYGIVNCLIPLYLVAKVPSLAQLRQPSLFLVFLAGVMLCLAPFLEFLF